MAGRSRHEKTKREYRRIREAEFQFGFGKSIFATPSRAQTIVLIDKEQKTWPNNWSRGKWIWSLSFIWIIVSGGDWMPSHYRITLSLAISNEKLIIGKGGVMLEKSLSGLKRPRALSCCPTLTLCHCSWQFFVRDLEFITADSWSLHSGNHLGVYNTIKVWCEAETAAVGSESYATYHTIKVWCEAETVP